MSYFYEHTYEKDAGDNQNKLMSPILNILRFVLKKARVKKNEETHWALS